MSEKNKLVFAHKPPAPDTTRCESCRNCVLTSDFPRQVRVYDENGSVIPLKVNGKPHSYVTHRCKVDHIVRVMQGNRAALFPEETPVRTCREVQLAECEGGKLYEPIH